MIQQLRLKEKLIETKRERRREIKRRKIKGRRK